jgi:hypothetical protein
MAILRGPIQVNNVTVFTAAGNFVLTTEAVAVVKKDSGAATQVTLPATPSRGQMVTVCDGKGDAATNNVTVVPAAGTINGAANNVISSNYGFRTYLYDGSQWLVIGS